MFLERIDDQVHAARRVSRESDLVRLGIDESRSARTHFFTTRKPVVPVNVAVVSHLFVISRTCLRSRLRERPGRGRIEINAPGRDGELRANFSPVDHVMTKYRKLSFVRKWMDFT